MFNKRLFDFVFVSFLGAFVIFPSSLLAQVATEGTLTCQIDKGDTSFCDYRHPAQLDVKNLTLKVGGQPNKIAGVQPYPAKDQSTAVLFLLDVSDPQRKATVANGVQHVRTLVARKGERKVGIAVFDSDLRVLAPIGTGANDIEKAVGKISAVGQATEFYKNILGAVELLKETNATRKALVVLSDGKAGDQAFRYEDVVKAAQAAQVSILSLGYAEKPADTPHLQILQRMAEDTGGVYYPVQIGSKSGLPRDLIASPYAFVEGGGRVTFASASLYGSREVALTLNAGSQGNVTLKTTAIFPDKRPKLKQAQDYVEANWIMLLVGGLVFVIALLALLTWRRRRARSKPVVVEYAYLEEFDGSRTRHRITQTAVRLGRSVDNDIQLVNDTISGHHAEIYQRREGGFYIVDLASTNGVFVNEKKVEQAELTDGDLVELGEVRLRFSC